MLAFGDLPFHVRDPGCRGHGGFSAAIGWPRVLQIAVCQILIYTSDKGAVTMSHLAENILSAARAMPEGGLLSPKELLHLG